MIPVEIQGSSSLGLEIARQHVAGPDPVVDVSQFDDGLAAVRGGAVGASSA